MESFMKTKKVFDYCVMTSVCDVAVFVNHTLFLPIKWTTYS